MALLIVNQSFQQAVAQPHDNAAFDLLRPLLPAATPVVFARAVTRPDEAIAIAPLETAQGTMADMRTLVIIGTAETRQIPRPDGTAFVYAPRRMA